MDATKGIGGEQKVFYRPIEAAIRWSGLYDRETDIFEVLGKKFIPEITDFPAWPQLRLNAERIYDGLINSELRHSHNGVADEDDVLLDAPDLTIRHVDLKAWMLRFYPDQRPSFLFDDFERDWHPAISLRSVQALLADREGLKIELADHERTEAMLQSQVQAIQAERNALVKQHGASLGPRAESTYLNIVGGLLGLLLGQSPGGVPYSSFKTQESIISALIAHYGIAMGIAERTLQSKFAQAKRQIQTLIR